jgi:membrane protein YdbS with pleckstrin-like domain
MRCEHCETEIPSAAAFCPGCGKRLDESAEPPAPAAPAAPAPSSAQQLQHKAEQVRAPRDIPEQELWRGAYSYKSMLGVLALGGLASIVGIVLLFVAVSPVIRWTIVGCLVALWIFIAAYVLRRRIGIHYRLTNQRFFIERGIFSRVTDRIEVIDINDMKYEQNLFERMFDVGSIKLTASDHSVPEFDLDGIEHVVEVANLIDQARRAERNRRGLYIEAS